MYNALLYIYTLGHSRRGNKLNERPLAMLLNVILFGSNYPQHLLDLSSLCVAGTASPQKLMGEGLLKPDEKMAKSISSNILGSQGS